MSSVNELVKNIDSKVMGLGADPRFRDNPAYRTALANMTALISQMNLFEAGNTVQVVEKDGVISFEWDKSYGERYRFEITVPSKDEIKCRRIKEDTSLLANKEVHEKNVVEVVAKLGNVGQMNITSNFGRATDAACDYRKGEMFSDVYYGAELKQYSPDGVMERRESRSYKGYRMNTPARYMNPESILIGTRGAFESSFGYTRRTLLVRDKLDVARVIFEDKETGEYYFGKQPLNQQHGLADMALNGGYKGYNDKVVIHPLMTSEIEKMLSKEDPKVAEGLRAYSVGREDYSYDSETDKDYEYKGAVK